MYDHNLFIKFKEIQTHKNIIYYFFLQFHLVIFIKTIWHQGAQLVDPTVDPAALMFFHPT